jgi:tetratricopeptide (TPR) repeat protein
LPKGSRAELHERFAAWLEQRVGDRAVEFEEILGYHLEQAYRTRIELGPPDDRAQQVAVRAGMRLASAGDRALAREDIPAAIKLLERGTFLLAQDGERSSAALLNLGTAVREAGDLARADELLGNAIDAAEAAEWPHLRARALVERSSLRAFIDRNVQADDLLRTAGGAIEVFERESDELGLAKAWIHVSEVHWMRCRCDEMEDVLERALEHARQARASREVSTILTALSRAALVGPRPAADGIARCRQLRERALGTSPTLYAEGDYLMAALEAMRGRFDEARALIDSGRRLLEEYGLRVRLASLPMYGAMIELWAGDPAAAERELRSAYDSLARMGERSYLSTIAGFLARALVEQGRHAEAEEKARISADSASADDVGTQIIWRGTCARALSRQGRRDEAERLATEAVELSSGIDFVTVKADATCDLANVLHDLGRRDESLPIFSDALKIYEDKGNVVAAGRVRAQLQAAESATA